MTRSCIEEAPPKGLGRREMKPVPSRVRRTLRRNFVTRTGGRLIFVSNFVKAGRLLRSLALFRAQHTGSAIEFIDRAFLEIARNHQTAARMPERNSP